MTLIQVLGALAAALTLLGWALIPLALSVAGRVRRPPEGSYERAWESAGPAGAAAYLGHIADPASGWIPVHIAFSVGGFALTLVPALYWGRLKPAGSLGAAALVLGTVGGLLGFLAVIFDLYGTPILARDALSTNDASRRHTAWLIWRYVESWRERAFKGLSLALLGLWMAWLGFHLQAGSANPRTVDGVLSWVSLASAALLALLAVTQVKRTRRLGERGDIGFSLLIIVILVWASLSIVWFVVR